MKRFCDNCGEELKEYDSYFQKRTIITFDKQIYDNKEYCERCYLNFLKLYDDLTKKNK